MPHTTMLSATPPALRVGDITLAADPSALSDTECRQRASLELLRQAAIDDGLLDAADPAPQDGVYGEAALDAIDRWLNQRIAVPEPDEASCRRHFAAHAAQYAVGERVQARHILFAVTEGTDVVALRQRAEQLLLDARSEPARFAELARQWSNCPSGAQGGELGWLTAAECAPEFARELFGQVEGQAHVGVLPRLVHSRFGLHVVEVQTREPGRAQPFEAVNAAVAQSLRQQAWITALRQTLSVLAARIPVQGTDLNAADSPLLQ